MRKKSRAGKEFELLIERIEKKLSPIGAVVKSPDYIRDLITNSFREVDVSITLTDGRLITVECRDYREKPQDDMWIEQLITKREKIGAWKTIAVSSSGFSKPAITTAQHYGVELRRLDQITDTEIAQNWAGNFKIELLCVEYGVLAIVIRSNGNILPKENFSKSLITSWENNLADTNFLRNKNDDTLLSAADIVKSGGQPPSLVENGDAIDYTWTIEFEDNDWCIETSGGEKDVSSVEVYCKYWLRSVPVPIQSVKQYSSSEKPLTQLVSGSLELHDRKFNIEARVLLNKEFPKSTHHRKNKNTIQ